jgi:hypothetical protein
VKIVQTNKECTRASSASRAPPGAMTRGAPSSAAKVPLDAAGRFAKMLKMLADYQQR